VAGSQPRLASTICAERANVKRGRSRCGQHAPQRAIRVAATSPAKWLSRNQSGNCATRAFSPLKWRFGILFGAVGAARDCLQEALSYADSRVQFGKPISEFQLTQRKFADMGVAVNTAMLLAMHLGRLKDEGRLRPEQVSVGKLNNVAAALQIARECRTILGGNGISLEYSPLRHANNLESVLTYEGTHEIHSLVVGQALTGRAAYR
jgi:alkylation response protein AidB-like acyl-CoA dehydrogenase